MSTTLHLIERARGGDDEALEALYARHRGRLHAFVASRLAPDVERVATPEDIVQETCLESARKIGAFEPQGPASFYRWLVGIARFKVSEAARAGRAKKRSLETPLVSEPVAAQTSPSGRVAGTERAALIRAALDAIPDSQAEAVRLRYLEGWSISECAERLECSPAAVKALVSRGLAALAAKLTSTL
ncbi:MAG: RNA polymerase sigma factor [Planctomycetota bacterium]|jgi:RNA polymerase sigma-70 factor (ECF subfamily)